jgi:hypothetical protein
VPTDPARARDLFLAAVELPPDRRPAVRVYPAEQTEPVKRQVALKLIRTGMDSNAVLARFDAERQALGLMDHPNSARGHDGVTTTSAGGSSPASGADDPRRTTGASRSASWS